MNDLKWDGRMIKRQEKHNPVNNAGSNTVYCTKCGERLGTIYWPEYTDERSKEPCKGGEFGFQDVG